LAAALSGSLDLLRGRRARDALAMLAPFASALAADPRIAARRAYGHALLGEVAEALNAAHLVSRRADADPVSLDLAGNALTLCHQPAAAYDAFRKAAAWAPEQASTQLNLAAAARFLGRMEEAESAYDRVIAAAPGHWEAWRARSELRRQTPARNHVAALETMLATGRLPPEGEIQLGYALGKEYEDLGDHDRAFAGFARGARARRARMRYDVGEDIDAMALIAQVFDAEYCAPGRESRDPAGGEAGPIFVLGLPRTGSTLLERMVGRHSQVQALGELQAFGGAMIAALRSAGVPPPSGKAGAIRASVEADPVAIGAAYLAAVSPLRDARPRFTDKLPLNFLYAGLIARALPSARIVHLTRDPADACLAIYKTLFEEAYPYSYDLRELGAYHNAYRRLMAHWRTVLGPRIIDVAYERLVTRPDEELPALLGRLGLRLEAACLRPEDGAAPVMTASASQARRPVHAKSVGIAERYRAHLGPLLEVLAGEKA
jgi:tetratricopeptide (TPR) repeat protein